MIDDIIADETLDKCGQPLLELVISGMHRGHSLWLLTQSYTTVPNNIKRQAKMLYVWYPKNRTDLNTTHEENDVIGPEELARVKAQLKQGKHTCLIMRMEHPRDYIISLYDSLSLVTGLLQDSCQEIIRLLWISYKLL